jgi:hypothetical protein
VSGTVEAPDLPSQWALALSSTLIVVTAFCRPEFLANRMFQGSDAVDDVDFVFRAFSGWNCAECACSVVLFSTRCSGLRGLDFDLTRRNYPTRLAYRTLHHATSVQAKSALIGNKFMAFSVFFRSGCYDFRFRYT